MAGQLAANAFGLQDGLDWKAVALGALGGGISAGRGGAGIDVGSKLDNTVVRAAVGNALNQGIAVVTGLQDKFSWKGVAASALGAGMGYGATH